MRLNRVWLAPFSVSLEFPRPSEANEAHQTGGLEPVKALKLDGGPDCSRAEKRL